MSAPVRSALCLQNYLDGVDVSSVQSSIDYDMVAAAGFRFAVVKVAEGLSGVDSHGKAHLAGFRAAGMYALPYLFLHPSQGAPELQVANLVRALGTTWPGRVCLDIETRYQAESNDEIVHFVEGAVSTCLRWGVLPPAIYSFPDYCKRLQPELSRSSLLASCPLWMATYGGPQPWLPPRGFTPYLPLPWTDWALHQYSGDGGYRVHGVFGDCDRNLFNGDEDAFRAWLGLPPRTPAPSIPPVAADPVPGASGEP